MSTIKIIKSMIGIVLLGIILISGCTPAAKDFTKFVNPLIGTDEEGHTFPGAVLPNGMVQLSPDTRVSTSKGASGYHYSDNKIIGFTHTHLSGTGEGSGGDFLFMPISGSNDFSKNISIEYSSKFSHKNEYAEPGYYKVLLDDNKITAELTVTKRVGFHKYTFPKKSQRNIFFDLVHGISDKADILNLKVISKTKIVGFRSSSGGLRMYQKLFFAAEFSEPFSESFFFEGKRIFKGLGETTARNVRAVFKFPNSKNPLLIKVAISRVNTRGAENNLKEISGWDFDLVKKKAKEEWNNVLNKISIKSKDKELKTIFYTSLYHTFIHPTLDMDINGRYRSTNNKIYRTKEFTNYTNFSLWDTFRGLHPLYTIINRSGTKDFIKTFIERYEHSGSLPMFEISGNEVPSMIGYHSLPVIADAYVKGIRNYNIDKAIKGMEELANLPWEKRNLYKTFGYIPYNYTVQSVSRTLEYAFDDWSLAQVLKNIDSNKSKYYYNRGNFYKNLFSNQTKFMQPKDSYGNWLKPFNPIEYSKHYTQANAYQYSLFVPQDVESLIDKIGGDKLFESWLDRFFSIKNDNKKNYLGQYNQGNEPSHHIAYLYNYAGAAWKTQKIVRKILTSQYQNTPSGLPGNDDAGELSAWFVFGALGFYPVTPGIDYYVIGSPLFDEVSLNLENGKIFKIVANNNSNENIYIQSASLNGIPYQKSFIKHSDIMRGGKIIFNMGNMPNKNWAIKKEDRPYSNSFNSLRMPKITVAGIPIPSDGVITFEDSAMVYLSSPDDGVNIFYTTDGTEPDTLSILYKKEFQVTGSTIIKAKSFKQNFKPSYATILKFRKLIKLPAKKFSVLKEGINFDYREVWLCKKVDDINKYSVSCHGVVPKITTLLPMKMSMKNGVVYSGFIKVPKDGKYIFYVDSDDGSTLSIDGIMIVNNDGSHRRRERSGVIVLAKGYHEIIVKHFQVGGKPKLSVKWKVPGVSKIEIPDSVFYH